MVMAVSFQFTASQGGWHSVPICNGLVKLFQFTASQGGWQSLKVRYVFVEYFNSQPRKEADLFCLSSLPSLVLFQFTASQGGWQIALSSSVVRLIFQFTASQGGWRFHYWGLDHVNFISIHSLARRLTEIPPRHPQRYQHFNSQPRKEADSSSVIVRISNKSFQFTASQGGWRSCHWQASCCTSYFNSQPRKEADKTDSPLITIRSTFQFTASQGGWRHTSLRRWTIMSISIHSLARRLT